MEKFKEHSLHLGGWHVPLEKIFYVASYLQPFNDELALRSLKRMLSTYVIEKNGRTVESLRHISFDNRSRPYISVLTIDGWDEKYQTILIRRQDAYLEEGLQEIYGEYRYQERIRFFALYGKRPQMCSRCIASPSILHRRATSPTFLDLWSTFDLV